MHHVIAKENMVCKQEFLFYKNKSGLLAFLFFITAGT